MPPTTAASRFSFERLTTWALALTLVLAAIILIPSASIPFAATKVFVIAAGAILTLAFYILARLSRGNIILPPLLLVGLLWLPVVGYALSTAFSGVSFTRAFWGTGFEPDTFGLILVAAILGTLAALAIRHTEQYRSFFTVAAYALGFIAVVELVILVVGQVAPSFVSPALSIVGSYSDLAIVLGFGLIASMLGLRFMEVSSRTRMFLMVFGVIALILLAVANSVLVWTLVALVALGLFVESVMQRNPSSGSADLDGTALLQESMSPEESGGERSLAAPLIVLAVSLFFLIGGTLGSALASGLHVNVLDVRPSWASTVSVGRQVYSHSPLFGSGPNTFGAQWLTYRDASLNSTVFWNIDFSSGIGFIPTSFVTTGFLGAILWLLFFGAFLFFGIRALIFRAPADAFQRFAAILTFVATVYFFTVTVFAFPGAIVLALAFVSAGLFASILRYSGGRGQWGIVFARAPRIGFVVVFALTLLLLASIVAAYSLTEHYLAQVDLARSAAAFNAGNLPAADAAAQASIAFAPTASAYQVEAQIAQTRLGDIAASTTLAAADASAAFQSSLSSGINAALTATRVDPSDYQNWLMLGNLYSSVVSLKVQGAYDNAKTAYEKAQTLNPTNPTIPYLLAQLEIANKNTKGAEDDLKAAIALKQDYTQAILLLSQLEVQDGNLKDALAAAEAAAYFTPTDPNVLFQVGILRAASGDTAGAISALSSAVSNNPNFANARYFLAAAYAKNNDFPSALAQLQAIAALSADNAKALETQIASLQAGKNPFPANLLAAPVAPVEQPTTPTTPAK